jgi:hypothetical protein
MNHEDTKNTKEHEEERRVFFGPSLHEFGFASRRIWPPGRADSFNHGEHGEHEEGRTRVKSA